MEPHELRRMFALQERHCWYRALRRRILAALERSGALAPRLGERAQPAAPLSPPPLCLDAGCGTGMLLAALDGRARLLGLDRSELALALARRRGLDRLVRASVTEIPLRDASQDIVVSADVLYHRDVRDDIGALREFARCLRPGGVLVLNLPAFGALRSTHDEAIHTARRYRAAEVRAKIEQAGLTPIEVRYWNWLLFPPIALQRLLRRRSPSSRPRPRETSGAAAGTGPDSDLRPLPSWVNEPLGALLRLEERLDGLAGAIGLAAPAGLSVLAVARKGDR
ncbi:MAG: class I SAM-dependent methyltransferase [Candidatus Eisenbacteria bacterium]|uniref:Class I SAM-dependent methyltransferase n=1 Tax=Eiseniibacteriota bacterium TaxID=2212470 RepID=A0A937XDJ3_UNCEI|nr:class I SAM-dependent methyltransferase [Candidatus Eisenbacteria bacterium]